jgi:DNA repair protein RadC
MDERGQQWKICCNVSGKVGGFMKKSTDDLPLTVNTESRRWRHPGGKLKELGAENLSDAELLSILISTGIKGRPAEKIAEEILAKFGSFKGMANQPFEKFLAIKGLADVKVIRIAAAFEIARRIVNEVIKEDER